MNEVTLRYLVRKKIMIMRRKLELF